jgi:hypothetical protein
MQRTLRIHLLRSSRETKKCFRKVFYLTDTGLRWDGWKVSVRDKVPQQERWVKQGLVFHSTQDIIKAIERRGEEKTRRRRDKGEPGIIICLIPSSPGRTYFDIN